MTRPTLPINPLLEHLASGGHRTLHDASVAAGVDWSGFHRAVRRGRICMWNADRIAIRLGTHPVLIWGDEWLNVGAYRSGRIDAAFDALRQEMAS